MRKRPEPGNTPPRPAMPNLGETERSLLIQAWIDTRMERDRSLLTLSGGGVGLLVTLLTAGLITSACPRLLAGTALLCFTVSILLALTVFHGNAEYVEKILATGEDPPTKLRWLDFWLVMVFGVGVVFLL